MIANNASSIELKDLTLREKIGQTVVLLSSRTKEKELAGSLEAFLARYPVGGFFVGAEIIKDVMSSNGFAQVKEATEEYKAATRIPLVFASDLENGCGSMIPGLTKLPFPMALGAADSEQLAYDYGKATALEGRLAGVNWTFSPVADLNVNRFNPITAIRAISDKPERAVPLLKALVRGLQDHGIAATAKHFPGDGCDYRDQHLTTTRNPLSEQEWLRQHGAVFQALVDDGLMSIMTGHIALPSFQRETEPGERYLPATLSRELTDTLLKQRMGFGGVVVSDALIMGGYLKWFDRDVAYLKSMQAGTDMMLWPELSYFDAMERAVESGELPIERLDDAVSRVLEMKRKLGLLAAKPEERPTSPSIEDSNAFAVRTSAEVAERSVTLVRDEQGLLPLAESKPKNVLVIGITSADSDYNDLDTFRQAFSERGIEATLRRNIWYEELIAIEGDYDLIVYAPIARHHRPMGPLAFFGDQASSCWSALTAGREKSIVVSFGSPYVIGDYFDMAATCINAYSNVPSTHRAVVRALLGEIPFVGRSPVDNL